MVQQVVRAISCKQWTVTSGTMPIDAAPYHLVERLFGFLGNGRALIGQLLRFATLPNYALRGGFRFRFIRHSTQALPPIV